ncbi:putative leucine-rich repeat-containing protein DDB_G0290503 isoform X2 [Macrobrachium rosenbergii]|uniref:putative leucine-rich repeat-containing protein DDB_G0290503 isoform X2 n=1 Tax=Macrobrachium rosenbergii TaxID=79674 RepID=UPI0034D67B02
MPLACIWMSMGRMDSSRLKRKSLRSSSECQVKKMKNNVEEGMDTFDSSKQNETGGASCINNHVTPPEKSELNENLTNYSIQEELKIHKVTDVNSPKIPQRQDSEDFCGDFRSYKLAVVKTSARRVSKPPVREITKISAPSDRGLCQSPCNTGNLDDSRKNASTPCIPSDGRGRQQVSTQCSISSEFKPLDSDQGYNKDVCTLKPFSDRKNKLVLTSKEMEVDGSVSSCTDLCTVNEEETPLIISDMNAGMLTSEIRNEDSQTSLAGTPAETLTSGVVKSLGKVNSHVNNFSPENKHSVDCQDQKIGVADKEPKVLGNSSVDESSCKESEVSKREDKGIGRAFKDNQTLIAKNMKNRKFTTHNVLEKVSVTSPVQLVREVQESDTKIRKAEGSGYNNSAHRSNNLVYEKNNWPSIMSVSDLSQGNVDQEVNHGLVAKETTGKIPCVDTKNPEEKHAHHISYTKNMTAFLTNMQENSDKVAKSKISKSKEFLKNVKEDTNFGSEKKVNGAHSNNLSTINQENCCGRRSDPGVKGYEVNAASEKEKVLKKHMELLIDARNQEIDCLKSDLNFLKQKFNDFEKHNFETMKAKETTWKSKFQIVSQTKDDLERKLRGIEKSRLLLQMELCLHSPDFLDLDCFETSFTDFSQEIKAVRALNSKLLIEMQQNQNFRNVLIEHKSRCSQLEGKLRTKEETIVHLQRRMKEKECSHLSAISEKARFGKWVVDSVNKEKDVLKEQLTLLKNGKFLLQKKLGLTLLTDPGTDFAQEIDCVHILQEKLQSQNEKCKKIEAAFWSEKAKSEKLEQSLFEKEMRSEILATVGTQTIDQFHCNHLAEMTKLMCEVQREKRLCTQAKEQLQVEQRQKDKLIAHVKKDYDNSMNELDQHMSLYSKYCDVYMEKIKKLSDIMDNKYI